VNHIRSLLEQIGLGAERVRMVNLSAAMAARFAEAAAEMDAKIRELGPNPLGQKVKGKKTFGGEE
jgi:F420-non-reducing hydrogenase iron-sulfur subunit